MKNQRLFNKHQSGFTLIELVTVIGILGILAVVAIPNFTDIRGEARLGSMQGVIGALNSANKINKATARSLGKGVEIVTNDSCDDAIGILLDGKPAGYSSSTSNLGGSVGDEKTCTLEDADGNQEDFEVYITGLL